MHWVVPLGLVVLKRFRRERHCCHSGLASGVKSLCRHAVTDLSAHDSPGSLRNSSSLGHSPSEPWPRRSRRACMCVPHNPAHRQKRSLRPALTKPMCARPPLGTSGLVPFGFRSLCFRVSKNSGIGLPQNEVAGP